MPSRCSSITASHSSATGFRYLQPLIGAKVPISCCSPPLVPAVHCQMPPSGQPLFGLSAGGGCGIGAVRQLYVSQKSDSRHKLLLTVRPPSISQLSPSFNRRLLLRVAAWTGGTSELLLEGAMVSFSLVAGRDAAPRW